MQEKSAAALLQQTRPQVVVPTTPIIPAIPAKVKADNPLQRLRLERGIPVKDMVEVVQALYPKYDKTVQSKVEHGNEYGINLRPDAMRALLNRFAPDRRSAARAPRRTKPYRVQARLSERVYGQLQQLTAQTGTTMQDLLERLIVDFLANRKEK